MKSYDSLALKLLISHGSSSLTFEINISNCFISEFIHLYSTSEEDLVLFIFYFIITFLSLVGFFFFYFQSVHSFKYILKMQ